MKNEYLRLKLIMFFTARRNIGLYHVNFPWLLKIRGIKMVARLDSNNNQFYI